MCQIKAHVQKNLYIRFDCTWIYYPCLRVRAEVRFRKL